MSTEKIYFLKGGEFFRLIAGALKPIEISEIIQSKEKVSLLIDDSYFFYVSMDNVSVTGKKLKAVAKGFLSIMFPSDLTKSYSVFQGNGLTLACISSDELEVIIENYQDVFLSVKKVSTPFLELISRYDQFIFCDGDKHYKRQSNSILLAVTDVSDYITSKELFAEIEYVKAQITLSGIKHTKFAKVPYIMPVAALIFCYIFFIVGGVFKITAASKVESSYNAMLTDIYTKAGVADSNDPYGMLLFKAGKDKQSFSGKRVVDLLSDLSDNIPEDVQLSTLSVRDKVIRIDGTAEDFAKIENLEKELESKLKININVDDAKKTDKGVTFVMRYEL